MSAQGRNVRIRVDGYTRVMLTVIAVLLTVLAVGLWAEAVPIARPAGAADGDGFGDSNAVRKDILKAAEQTNAKLDEMLKLFKSGDAKVQVADGKGAGDGNASAPK